jgi:hypothetical protein
MSSPSEPIDILVPCHSYLNTNLEYGLGAHDPVFLFLYDKKAKTYKKINITDVADRGDPEKYPAGWGLYNFLDLELNHNIHIKFIDRDVKASDVNFYQYNDMEKLAEKGYLFDYIFPIHCPGKLHLDYLKFLKPTGKLLEFHAEFEPHFIKTRDKATQTKYMTEIKKRRAIHSSIDLSDLRPQIEFRDYLASGEPYIYKDDISDNAYYGWYKIYQSPEAEAARATITPKTKTQRRTRTKKTTSTTSGGRRIRRKTRRRNKRKSQRRA